MRWNVKRNIEWDTLVAKMKQFSFSFFLQQPRDKWYDRHNGILTHLSIRWRLILSYRTILASSIASDSQNRVTRPQLWKNGDFVIVQLTKPLKDHRDRISFLSLSFSFRKKKRKKNEKKKEDNHWTRHGQRECCGRLQCLVSIAMKQSENCQYKRTWQYLIKLFVNCDASSVQRAKYPQPLQFTFNSFVFNSNT